MAGAYFGRPLLAGDYGRAAGFVSAALSAPVRAVFLARADASRAGALLGAGSPGRWSRFSTPVTPGTVMTDSAIAFIWSAVATSPRSTTIPPSALTEMRPLSDPPRTSL